MIAMIIMVGAARKDIVISLLPYGAAGVKRFRRGMNLVRLNYKNYKVSIASPRPVG